MFSCFKQASTTTRDHPSQSHATHTESEDLYLIGTDDYIDEGEVYEDDGHDDREGSLDEWLLNKAKQHLENISIAVASKNGKKMLLFKKKTKFNVMSTIANSEQSVIRSYQDFQNLHLLLQQRFPNAFVPPLPPSKSIGAKDDHFLRKRMFGLTFFLQSIARNPFLNSNIIFTKFMSSPEKFKLKAAQGVENHLKHGDAHMSEGLRRWKQAIHQTKIPTNSYVVLKAVIKESEALESSLRSLYTASKNHVAALQSLASSNVEMSKLLGCWKEVEAKELATIKGGVAYVAEHDDAEQEGEQGSKECKSFTMEMLLTKQSFMSVKQDELLAAQVSQARDHLLAPLLYEIRYIETFVRHLKSSKAMIVKHRNAVKAYRNAVSKAMMANDTALSTAIPDAPSAATGTTLQVAIPANNHIDPSHVDRIDKLRKAALSCQREVKQLIRGLLVLELGRYRSERTVRFTELFHKLAELRLSYSHRMKTIWQYAVTDLPVDVPPTAELMMLGNVDLMMLRGPTVLPYQHGRAGVPQEQDDGTTTRRNSMPRRNYRAPTLEEPEVLMQKLRQSLRTDGANSPAAATGGMTTYKLRVLYTNHSDKMDELDIFEGDVLEGVVYEEDPNWYLVTNDHDETGLVPANFVKVLDNTLDDDDDVESEDEWGDDDDDGYEEEKSGVSKMPPPSLSQQLESTIRNTPPPLPTGRKPKPQPKQDSLSALPPQDEVAEAEEAVAAPAMGGLLSAIQGFNKSALQSVDD